MFDIMSVVSGICINEIVSMINFELLEASYLKLSGIIYYPAVGVDNGGFGDISQNGSKDSCVERLETLTMKESFVSWKIHPVTYCCGKICPILFLHLINRLSSILTTISSPMALSCCRLVQLLAHTSLMTLFESITQLFSISSS